MAARRRSAAADDVNVDLLELAKGFRAVEKPGWGPTDCVRPEIAGSAEGLFTGSEVVRLKVDCCVVFEVADAVMLSSSARKESSTKKESSSKSSDIVMAGVYAAVRAI